MKAAHQVPVARLHHDRRAGGDGAQGAEVGVVHVGVREEDGVERRQLALAERRLDQPPRPELDEPAPEADARLEHGVGEHEPAAEEVEQHRGVAQPGRR